MRKPVFMNGLGGIPTLKMHMLLDLRRYLDKDIGMDGVFEPHLTDFIRKSVTKESVCVDVGGNIGYYSAIFTHLAKHTLILEPSRYYAQIIQDMFAYNAEAGVLSGAWELEEVGASDEEATYDIHIGECSGTVHWAEKFRPREVESCRFLPLDDILAGKSIGPVDFIKVDCDGHDLKVLQGAGKTLAEDRPVVTIEIAPKQLKLAGGSPAEIYSLLETYGYTVRHERKPGDILSRDRFLKSIPAYNRSANMIAVPE